jgi:ferric-dicitrate binding protein FerR (iron transport regulator)
VALILKVERIEGEVRLGDGTEARAGQELPSGGGVETGPGQGSATLVYRDASRIELGPGSLARELTDLPKQLLLTRGTVAAEVTRQPAGQPFAIRTPHAEARVLGTSFRLRVEAEATRLEVKSGRVRLTRLADGKSVDVAAGQFAVAGPAEPPVARPLAARARPVLLSETFEDPRGVEARWKSTGGPGVVRTAGRLDLDLAARTPEGWSGGGLQTKQAFAVPFAVSTDVEIPVLHAGVVTALVLVPQGKKRKDEGVLRVQLRENRYALFTESGEPRELAGAARAGEQPARERWRVEVQADHVRVLAGDRELFRHRPERAAPAGYVIELDASARADAPSGARAGFDNVLIEPLR